jgi:MFS family permease
MTINRWLALALLFLARTAMGFQFQSLGAVSPLLMRDLGIEFALLGTLVGIWMLPGAFVAVPGGALGHRFGEKRMVVLGLGLMALGTLMIAMAGTYEAVFAGRLVSGIGAVIVNVLLTKMAADWFADRELSTAMGLLVVSWPLGIGVALVALGMGVYYTWYYVGMAVLPPAAGYVRDATGLFAAPLLFGGALLVLGAIAFYVFVHLAGAGKAAGAFRPRPMVRKN